MRRLARLTLLACLAAAMALGSGCGRDRIEPPDTARPASPVGTAEEAYPRAGLFLDRPGNWPFRAGTPPLVASATSGTATIALWRYLRSEPLPREEEPLAEAEANLEEAVRSRDENFDLTEIKRVKVDGAPGIQVVGTTTVAGEKRSVRSTHVYAKEAEFVLDAYAPEGEFARVDREVFAPILESLRIDPPQE